MLIKPIEGKTLAEVLILNRFNIQLENRTEVPSINLPHLLYLGPKAMGKEVWVSILYATCSLETQDFDSLTELKEAIKSRGK